MSDHWENPAVCWHTDPDEAFLVGTKESYIKLAELLVKLADSTTKESSIIDGVKVSWPSSNDYLTEFGLDIVLQGIGLVENKEEALKVTNHFRRLNGELPLADD